MRNVKILAAAGLLSMAGIAQADVTGTATITTDYDFRGFTQSANDVALQASIDYASEGGWYAGIWGSNIGYFSDFDAILGANNRFAQTEIDLYTGFKGTAGDLGWDAGIVYYAYPNASDLNYVEIYGKLSFSILSAGLYYSDDFGGLDGAPNGGVNSLFADSNPTAAGNQAVATGESFYLYGDLNIPAGPLVIGLHAGYSDGDGIEGLLNYLTSPYANESSYMDYSVGLSYPVSNFTLGMKWVATDAGDRGSDDRFLLTFSTAFPWAE